MVSLEAARANAPAWDSAIKPVQPKQTGVTVLTDIDLAALADPAPVAAE
jgi:hypothetical protein